jgi:hypothetical protein
MSRSDELRLCLASWIFAFIAVAILITEVTLFAEKWNELQNWIDERSLNGWFAWLIRG